MEQFRFDPCALLNPDVTNDSYRSQQVLNSQPRVARLRDHQLHDRVTAAAR